MGHIAHISQPIIIIKTVVLHIQVHMSVY